MGEHIFISYASEDAVFAQLVKMTLEASNIEVWLDSGNLRMGEEWRDAIDRGIDTAGAVLVILTPHSSRSEYVTYEWAYALGKGKRIIPLLYKETNIHPRLDVIQHEDFQDPQAFPWAKLILEVKNQLKSVKSDDNAPDLIQDMTANDLKKLIAGAVALANANASRHPGSGTLEETDVSDAAESVVEVMRGSPEKQRGSRNKLYVLWVDDRPNNNQYERAAFESVGYSFTLALSTQEALQILEQQTFAAIISDMGRKEGPNEGYVLLDAVRKKDDQIPYFFYSRSNTPKDKQKALERGAQGFTNSANELLRLVSSYLS